MDGSEVGWAEVGLRLVLAMLAGGLIGFDREAEGKDAGVRTHMLLALGAATFGVISVAGFGEFEGDPTETNVTIDVTRVASYVAAGVGFLGGGTILKNADRIQGLTTAGSLWAVSAIGLAAGVGFLAAAVVGTVLAGATLLAEGPVRWLTGRRRS